MSSVFRNSQWVIGVLLTSLLGTSCSMMTDEREHCPTGLYVMFKYDYNLQRANMFCDHVEAVTLYIYNEQGELQRTEQAYNTPIAAPLRDAGYKMHITGLKPGKYQFIALAGQRPYEEMLADHNRARFVRNEPGIGDPMQQLDITLDHQPVPSGEGVYTVDNLAAPLDTLWHGMSHQTVEIKAADVPVYETISLVRDTKKINITLRELDEPQLMNIDDYELTIIDRNAHILWDNSLDETHTVVYTPHATWNTEDLPVIGNDAAPGRMGHADFMTSRILKHIRPDDDAVLQIVKKSTGSIVARVNLADYLSRLRVAEERYIYTPQEFLDRGYDYRLTFFLCGDTFQYVSIEISVLSWSIRVQNENLGE